VKKKEKNNTGDKWDMPWYTVWGKMGRLDVIPSKDTMAFLSLDWLYFLWLGDQLKLGSRGSDSSPG